MHQTCARTTESTTKVNGLFLHGQRTEETEEARGKLLETDRQRSGEKKKRHERGREKESNHGANTLQRTTEEGTNSRKTEIDDYLQSLYKKWLDKKRGATQPDSRKYPKFKTPSSYAQRFKVNSYLAGRFIRMFSSLEIRNVGGYVSYFGWFPGPKPRAQCRSQNKKRRGRRFLFWVISKS